MSSGEYWEDEDEWQAEEASTGGDWTPASGSGDRSAATLALGLVAMTPLFLAYEYGIAHDSELQRTLSERTLFRLFGEWPSWESLLRRGSLCCAVLWAMAICYRRRLALGPSLMRVFLEGCLGAIVLGPALVLGIRLFGGFGEEMSSQVGDTALPVAARVLGGAAFEELLFRVGIFSAGFLLARRSLSFFGAGQGAARWVAEIVANLVSALGFAAIHVTSLSSWLGEGGEVWNPAVFAWRALAGVLLAILFRWRGPGVAAWTHGLFNLTMLLGAGPEVLL